MQQKNHKEDAFWIRRKPFEILKCAMTKLFLSNKWSEYFSKATDRPIVSNLTFVSMKSSFENMNFGVKKAIFFSFQERNEIDSLFIMMILYN